MPNATTVPHFQADESGISCDGVPLASIAERLGTPVYVYSAEAVREGYRRFDDAFREVPHALHYALKANSSLAVLRLLRALGSGADANSGGEITVALRAGFVPADIVFSGVGKTRGELAQAVSLGVKAINAESAGEVARLDAVARELGRQARVAVRVNPGVDSRSHPHLATGLRESKFGVPIARARGLYREMTRRSGLLPVGVHVHVGSQILSLDPLVRAAEMVAELVRELKDDGVALEHVDLGGGLGIPYGDAPAPTPAEFAARILPVVGDLGVTVLLEPGRVIVGPAGVLVARVVDLKDAPSGRRVAILDCGMTELVRPALYGAFHRIEPVARRAGPAAPCDIDGPLCESSDTIGRERLMPPLEVDDLMALFDVGAYGAAMASTYNRRPLAPEVLVDEGQWRVIRRRQTIDDLVALEE